MKLDWLRADIASARRARALLVLLLVEDTDDVTDMLRDKLGDCDSDKLGDEVCVSSPKLGVLRNRVTTCEAAPPWTFGITGLMSNLAKRGLL